MQREPGVLAIRIKELEAQEDDMNWDRMKQASKIGPMALLRLRAEVLWEHANSGALSLTDAQRDALDRIAVSPTEADRDFLGSFDWFFEQRE